MDECFDDKYFMQRNLIKDLTRRERRIEQAILELRNTPGGMTFKSVTKSKSKNITNFTNRNIDGDEWAGNEIEQTNESSSRIAEPVQIRIMQLEDALTRVQGRKQAAINQLHKMQQNDEKGGETSDNVVEAIKTLLDVVRNPAPNRTLPDEDGGK